MIYAVYRLYYGEDFIGDSLASIKDYVDKIFVFWTREPWGNIKEVVWKDNVYTIPTPIDNAVDMVRGAAENSDQLITRHHHVENNDNQFTILVNEFILPAYPKPDKIIFIEHDHVFERKDIEKLVNYNMGDVLCKSTRQIEHWKAPEYRIPERPNRNSVMVWNMKLLTKIPPTGKHANIVGWDSYMENVFVHNFGFCMPPQNMFYKFLLSLGYSKKIGDVPPNEDWFMKWLLWRPYMYNENLEISQGYEHLIRYAEPYEGEPVLFRSDYRSMQ